ncbi:MAG: hypothetical protein KDK70_14785 [Myxococcales bacterium]|nr:hypothetical protein [Myxococcales bacterium]
MTVLRRFVLALSLITSGCDGADQAKTTAEPESDRAPEVKARAQGDARTARAAEAEAEAKVPTEAKTQPEPDAAEDASAKAAGDPRPEVLAELIGVYEPMELPPPPKGVPTLSPSYANYRRYLLEAARGDGAALGRLMSLRLDGAGFDAHATNLESLLLGLGDAVFAEALAGQTPEAKTATFAALDFAQQLGPDDPKHYRHSHPKTFALQPPAEP